MKLYTWFALLSCSVVLAVALRHRSPKDASLQSGKPMVQLIPQTIKAVSVLPRPVQISFVWNPVLIAASYTLYYGTNHASYFWTTNVPGTNATITVTFPKSVLIYASVTAIAVTGQESPYSNEARVPDWPYNGVVISWNPSNQPVRLQTSPDLRSWTDWQTGLSPMTNTPMIDTLFFRARSPVILSIQPLRLWSAADNHFGG